MMTALRGSTKETSMTVEVGNKAPDFTLVNQDRENVTLSQELKKGNVVLAFFPGAFSGTCTKEMCNFRDTMSSFTKVNANVLGISTDTFFALKAWRDQQHFEFPLLSDYNKEVIGAYGVVNPDMIGLKNIAKRAVFVIDKGGSVRYREVMDDARNEPDYDRLNEALAKLGK
jgi:glutaredoxin-dependent peroxiredoxin